MLPPYSPKCLENLSDNSKRAPFRSSKRGHNKAARAVSAPFVPPNAGAQGCHSDLSDSFWKGNSWKFAKRLPTPSHLLLYTLGHYSRRVLSPKSKARKRSPSCCADSKRGKNCVCLGQETPF